MPLSESECRQASDLLVQCTAEVANPQFVPFVTERFARLFDFDRCHFASLDRNGRVFFHGVYGDVPFGPWLRCYEHQDQWKPPHLAFRPEGMIDRIRPERIERYARTYELYDHLSKDLGLSEAVAGIHPAGVLIAGLRVLSRPLPSAAYELFRLVSLPVVNCFLLNRRLYRLEEAEDGAGSLLAAGKGPVFLEFDGKGEWIRSSPRAGTTLEYAGIPLGSVQTLAKRILLEGRRGPADPPPDPPDHWLLEGKRGTMELRMHPIRHAGELHHLLTLRPVSRPVSPVTPRQRAVAALVKKGLTNKEIAQILAISEETVKRHLFNACHAIGARNRVDLINRLFG